MTILILILAAIAVRALFYYFKYFVPLRTNERGFKYVHVENDGSVRELNKEEELYLSESFHPNDGDRPYIKLRYDQLTPDGKISGFIARRRIPTRIKIK